MQITHVTIIRLCKHMMNDCEYISIVKVLDMLVNIAMCHILISSSSIYYSYINVWMNTQDITTSPLSQKKNHLGAYFTDFSQISSKSRQVFSGNIFLDFRIFQNLRRLKSQMSSISLYHFAFMCLYNIIFILQHFIYHAPLFVSYFWWLHSYGISNL